MTPDIVHVAATPSFMNFVADAFEEVAPGRNLLVSIATPIERFRLPASTRAEVVQRDDAGAHRLDELIAESRVAVFHNVAERMVAYALAAAPATTLRVWSGWGGDYYGSDLDGLRGLIGPATRRVVRKTRPLDYWPERLLELRHLRPALRAAALSADVFSAPIPEDFRVFRRRFRGFHGRYGQLNYGSVEDTFAVGPSELSGQDILLGNSSTPENNHLDVLAMLAREDLGDAKVFAPLAYGDPAYAEVVAARGTELLGDRFIAITESLPLEEYHDLLSRCSVFVMGQRRQQALGNIFHALWQGAHVVFDRRNPVIGYLRDRGAIAHVLGQQPIGSLLAAAPTREQVAANRAMLERYWGRAAVLRNIEELLAAVPS